MHVDAGGVATCAEEAVASVAPSDQATSFCDGLTAAKKKWIEANKEQKAETVRDVEFTTYFWTPTNSPAAKPDAGGNGNDLDSVLPGKGDKQQIAALGPDEL